MSLTTVLKDPTLRAKFKDRFPVPKTSHTEILIPAPSKKASIIGTAFDYIIRFHIKEQFPSAIDRQWVAEKAVDEIKYKSGEYVLVDDVAKPFDRTMEPHDQYPDATRYRWTVYSREWAEWRLIADNVLNHAKRQYNNYIKTGTMTRDLLEASLNLATLDLIIRTGRIFYMPTVTDEIITDMETLYNVMRKSNILRPEKRAFLNPTFNDGSALVGGADADLIIDDISIDIKTTKSDSFTQDMYNQLLGYYALSTFRNDIGGISKMGVYFSRYGKLDIVDAPDQDAVAEIIRWFEEHRELQQSGLDE